MSFIINSTNCRGYSLSHENNYFNCLDMWLKEIGVVYFPLPPQTHPLFNSIHHLIFTEQASTKFLRAILHLAVMRRKMAKASREINRDPFTLHARGNSARIEMASASFTFALDFVEALQTLREQRTNISDSAISLFHAIAPIDSCIEPTWDISLSATGEGKKVAYELIQSQEVAEAWLGLLLLELLETKCKIDLNYPLSALPILLARISTPAIGEHCLENWRRIFTKQGEQYDSMFQELKNKVKVNDRNPTSFALTLLKHLDPNRAEQPLIWQRNFPHPDDPLYTDYVETVEKEVRDEDRIRWIFNRCLESNSLMRAEMCLYHFRQISSYGKRCMQLHDAYQKACDNRGRLRLAMAHPDVLRKVLQKPDLHHESFQNHKKVVYACVKFGLLNQAITLLEGLHEKIEDEEQEADALNVTTELRTRIRCSAKPKKFTEFIKSLKKGK